MTQPRGVQLYLVGRRCRRSVLGTTRVPACALVDVGLRAAQRAQSAPELLRTSHSGGKSGSCSAWRVVLALFVLGENARLGRGQSAAHRPDDCPAATSSSAAGVNCRLVPVHVALHQRARFFVLCSLVIPGRSPIGLLASRRGVRCCRSSLSFAGLCRRCPEAGSEVSPRPRRPGLAS